jgi:hypothetical protein
VKPPEPNASPIQIGEFTVEQRVCECCKEPKPRFFVKKDAKIVMMASDWKLLCKQLGWD